MSKIKHYGDITKILGNQVEPVDIITGGSPCQDLSVAGKRAGLAGERSGLFMEQIRIIKEMRDHDRANGRTNEHIRPRYMVWENVPGAFSSNKGEDFRAVLEETAKVADKDAVIPGPPKGKWSPSGCIVGDGWSIAWRVHDAQFWGVPQRRKRIALVADFGGETAPEILFERKGLSGDFAESGKERQGAAEDAGRGITQAGRAISFQERAGKSGESKGILIQNERTGALSTLNNQSVCLEGNGQRDSHKGDGYKESETMYTLNTVEQHAVCIENHPADSRVKISEDGVCQTLSGRMGTGGRNVPMVMESSSWDGGQVSPTLTANNAGGSQRMPDKENFNAVLTYGLDRASFNQGINAKYDFAVDEEKIGTQVARGPGAVLPWTNSVVRRLTPLECERLQGFPNHWTDIGDWVDSKGKTHKGDSDSPRYKALGNSIALPFWQWMAERMVWYISHTPTMASLFDGIGGFPLSFSRCGCVPVWASEIEEFPIAVTKKRFAYKEV